MKMSTITVIRPEDTTQQPDWRRLCHWYNRGSQRFVCGTATRKQGQDHSEEECRARGHTICVVCTEFVESKDEPR
jgi:hypothetical protein